MGQSLLVHIADATADAILSTLQAASLATKFTMEERFYLDIMEARGIRPSFPMPNSAKPSTDHF